MEYAIETQVIDVAQREVRRQDACVPVEPKVFDLLLYLVENRARVVAKDELVERIWNGRAISDAALSSCVEAARRTLGDDGQQQRFIRTINRRGFRFVGPVETHDRTMPAADVQARSPEVWSGQSRRGHIAGGCRSLRSRPDTTGTTLGSGAADLRTRRRGSAGLARRRSHPRPNGAAARTRWLFVTARASAARYHASAFDPVEIGRRLGVGVTS